MDDTVRTEVCQRLGSRVVDAARVRGGDINEAFRVRVADGRVLFVKYGAKPTPGMFGAEARGLGWLAEGQALRVPKVLAVADHRGTETPWLALEWIEPGSRRSDFDEHLGRGLAALHRAAPLVFGLDHGNFIGRLPQDNTPENTWATFFRARRLEPQLTLAVDTGRSTRAMRTGFERLFARLEELLDPPDAPARLHGDLWAGNLHVDERGEPCLIDPAVYGGAREVDLAMMRLFGGFGERVFEAYHEAWPLAPGLEGRIAICQLYPLLVHVNLFGGSYIAAVERALADAR